MDYTGIIEKAAEEKSYTRDEVKLIAKNAFEYALSNYHTKGVDYTFDKLINELTQEP